MTTDKLTDKLTVDIPVSIIESLDRVVESINEKNDYGVTRNNIVSYALQKLVASDFTEITDERFKDVT
ncbi:MAG: hypothetical protein WAM95_11570 [Bacillus sp. (in: firmicutes)]|jgi:hypothetical protein